MHRGLIRSETSTGLLVATTQLSTMVGWALRSLMMVVLWSSSTTQLLLQVGAVPAQSPEQCGTSGCTLHNAYGLWNDRSSCKAAKVVYPTTEEDIVEAVANAVRANQKIKVSTTYSHSIPKGACPGTDAGVIISSKNLLSFVSVDKAANTVTVQSGITMRALVDGIASHGLALPTAPLFDGLTLGGVIANSAHGSMLWGKGGAVHEYVVGVRLVTPASAAEGYAKVRNIALGDPDLNAARVHLGVLGVVSTVTVQVEPQFKRSVTLRVAHGDDELTGAKVLEIAKDYQYGEVWWYPALREVVYKLDNRVPVTTPGDGRNNYFGMQPQSQVFLEAARADEDLAELTRSRESKCLLARTAFTAQEAIAYGYEHQSSPQGIPNPGIFPVTGTQNHMMIAGGCQRDPNPFFYCGWDSRIRGIVYFDEGAALPLRKLASLIDDMKLLRERAPAHSFCGLDLYAGIRFRFVTRTEAYLGTAQEDTVVMDFTWSRGNDSTTPRLDMDVFQEVEQLAFEKHGARPHWGKNRKLPFDGAWTKYPGLTKFLDVKQRFDPAGLFSSEWSDAILGIAGNVSSDAPFCAIEGNCKCSRDEHCAPLEGYFCRPGLVYPGARVCRFEN